MTQGRPHRPEKKDLDILLLRPGLGQTRILPPPAIFEIRDPFYLDKRVLIECSEEHPRASFPIGESPGAIWIRMSALSSARADVGTPVSGMSERVRQPQSI